MDSLIDPHLCRTKTQMDDLTFSIQQLTSLVVPPRQREDFVTTIDTSLEVDGGAKVIGSESNTRPSTLSHETMPILQTLGDVVGEIFTPTIDIPDSTGHVDGEISFELLTLVWTSSSTMTSLWCKMVASPLHLS